MKALLILRVKSKSVESVSGYLKRKCVKDVKKTKQKQKRKKYGMCLTSAPSLGSKTPAASSVSTYAVRLIR